MRLLPYSAAALPLAAMVLYAKFRLMTLLGYRVVTRSLGRSEDIGLTLGETISFYRADLVVLLVMVPLFFLLLAALTRPRWRPLVVGTAAAILMVGFYAQSRALGTVGTFLHIQMVISAIRFASERPEYVGSYITIGGLLKTGAALGLTFAILWWAHRRDSSGAAPPAPRASAMLGVPLGILLVAPWLPRVERTTYHDSLLGQAVSATWFTGADESARYRGLPAESLAASYRGLTGIPASPPDARLWGRASGMDLLVLVLETVPTRCLDLTAPIADLPTMRALRKQGWVLRNHLTSYPYSSLANFSLLSSWYPPDFARAYTDRHGAQRVPGLLWALRDRGYRTALYEPYRSRFEDDPVMYRMLGVERQIIPGTLVENARPSWQEIIHADSNAIRTVRDDIAAWTAAGERWAAIVLPQTSHGPWHDPVPGRAGTPLLDRCRALVAIQDTWLGQILSDITTRGRGDSTIVVVTADHGVRTRQEDPSFEPGMLTDYSFQVPLLLFVPGMLDTTVVVDAVTSTLDVAPTLLDLLGVERERWREQGNTIWDPRLPERRTFLLAGEYFGATGYHDRGRFLAWNELRGLVCVADRLHCPPDALVRHDAPLADTVRFTLLAMAGLQVVWLERFLEDAPNR